MVIEHERNILFVNSVKLYPCLYDCTNPHYNKLSVKENAWKEISKKMGDPVLLCKQRWKNLRTVFIRHLKQQSINGSAENYRRKYYLEDAMHFVIPFLINKNNSDKKEKSILPQSEEDCLNNDGNYDEDIVKDEEFERYIVPERNLHNSSEIKKETEDTRINSRWHCSDTQKEVDSGKHFVTHVETRKKNLHQESADQKFLLSLLPDLKEMNPQQKRRFKRESLELISRILEDPVPENESFASDALSSHPNISAAETQSQTSSDA